MSKIEKALNKAKSTGSLRVIPSQNDREREDKPLAETTRSNMPVATIDIEQRANASELIARMREIAPLDKHALTQYRLIHPEMGENRTVRAFREIRTKVIQKTQGRNCVIMVTSVTSKGGSSFVSLNLSAAFAFDAGKTALLMDCNFRNPFLHKMFNARKEPYHGLTDYLENPDMDIADIIHPIGIERLRVIPSGGQREIPAEYFTSVKMRRLLESIRQRYRERYIVLDAPPMTESADTQIIAELCDYVVLVVPYGKVSDAQVVNSAKAIGEKKLLGVVFNNEPVPPDLGWRNLFRNPLAFIAKAFKR